MVFHGPRKRIDVVFGKRDEPEAERRVIVKEERVNGIGQDQRGIAGQETLRLAVHDQGKTAFGHENEFKTAVKMRSDRIGRNLVGTDPAAEEIPDGTVEQFVCDHGRPPVAEQNLASIIPNFARFCQENGYNKIR